MSNIPEDLWGALHPLLFVRDGRGEYLCPMAMMVHRSRDEDDDARRVKVPCGEILRIHWQVVTPVPDHDSNEPVMEVGVAWTRALWSSWDLKCPNGHVLATSAQSDSDTAQPFDARHWWLP